MTESEKAICKTYLEDLDKNHSCNEYNLLTGMLEQEPTVSIGAYQQVMWERDLAISQLKELGYGFGEKIEPCEDCISRQAAIDAAMKDVSDIRTHDFNAGATRAANRIAELPTVQPARRKGKWIIDWLGNVNCPFCGNSGYGNFCNECGADMREGGKYEPDTKKN